MSPMLTSKVVATRINLHQAAILTFLVPVPVPDECPAACQRLRLSAKARMRCPVVPNTEGMSNTYQEK